MRWFIAVLCCSLSLMLTGFTRAEEKAKGKEVSITGVKGQFIRVERNNKTADKVERLQVKPGTWVEVEWTYPIAPPFTSSVEAKSSDTAVMRFVTVNSVVHYPLRVGVGKVGAFFVADKAGHATLTFDIKSGDAVVNLKVEVEVK